MKRYEKPEIEILVFEENIMVGYGELEDGEIDFSGWEDGGEIE